MKELEAGIKIGRGSLVFTLKALSDALGRWSKLLPYLESFTASDELELVASINYLLGRELEFTPPLKARLASDFVMSSKKILVSDAEFMHGLDRLDHSEG